MDTTAFTVFGLGIALAIGVSWIVHRVRLNVEKYSHLALQQLDMICEGRHFVGRESKGLALREVVDSWSQRSWSRWSRFEQLCQGAGGVFFVYRFWVGGDVSGAVVRVEGVEVLGQQAAAKWLEPYPDRYRAIFGPPSRA